MSHLIFYVEDEKGNLMAGLIAETFGNWLEIEYLFVKEELRGQGLGSNLLQQAETEAKNRNCRFAFCQYLTSFKLQIFIKCMAKGSFYLQDYPYTGKDFITKKICKENMKS